MRKRNVFNRILWNKSLGGGKIISYDGKPTEIQNSGAQVLIKLKRAKRALLGNI